MGKQIKAIEKKVACKKSYLPTKIQFFGAQTLFELKQNLATIGQQLKKTEDNLAQKAIDPSATMDDITALQRSRDDLKMRFDVVKEQHDSLEAEQKAKFSQQQAFQQKNNPEDPKQKVLQAKAELIRSTMNKQPVSNEVYQALGDDGQTGGGKFLPKTVSSDIIVEPFVKNQLRDLSTFTQITNLEIPKLNFALDDDDFIADKETAKELKATGDTVSFGRHKFKVFAGISETVLNGTHTNLVSHVDRALQSGVAAKEKKVAFATTPKSGEEHMSFYYPQNNIKVVNGANMYQAIRKAIADLHEDYRENAKIVMTYQDYSDIIEFLANGNATLYTAQPEQILGKPVTFSDSAVDPVVGDFSYSHYNYDLNVLYDRDKDVKTGIEQFVITAWMDHQIKLKSAFRIAKTETP
ncbi:phage major capsid protein [Alkalihalophilus lindianensis]|uniref:Phage major capsid protein n=1 Tax=Alkalihalophilus lindianensis TaxID=1630542 RepID=A0ABU3X7K6_9BACI|nr:phage major capsid protein [Alkalihalophilus lindianensis]MDV2683807.1 phage major capsid protein [Alkalihalophilus lindianensis]MDV2683873.1 phage major capsid protein [Alkalihalophilus lindianensis]